MRRSNHTDAEIVSLLKEAENGVPVEAICATALVSTRTFYRWRKQLGGLSPDALRRLRLLEQENQHLRLLVARLKEPNAGGAWCGLTDGGNAPRTEFGAATRTRPLDSWPDSVPTPSPSGATTGRFGSLRMASGR